MCIGVSGICSVCCVMLRVLMTMEMTCVVAMLDSCMVLLLECVKGDCVCLDRMCIRGDPYAVLAALASPRLMRGKDRVGVPSVS